MQVSFQREQWEFKVPFRISYRTRTHAQTLVVQLEEGGHVGRGETGGVSYHGETVDTLFDQLSDIAPDLRNGLSRAELQNRLPAGGARNAVDCALWDLEAKRAGRRAWELVGLTSVQPLLTTLTLGIDTPEVMSRAATAASRHSLLKLKLMGDDEDLNRVTAIRKARPDVRLVVDANQGWSERHLLELTPQFAALGVELIEQPLPIGKDDVLADFDSPIPLCADESCQTTASLPELTRKYDFINIKLDKAGGLTEALKLVRTAKAEGFRLMVGCMAGSSLGMAPAFIIGQWCEFADLDGPLLLKADISPAIRYEGSQMFVPEAQLWG